MKKINYKAPFFIAAVLLLVILTFYFTKGTITKPGEDKLAFQKPAKYIFYFIGDGMSMQHIHLTEAAMPHAVTNRNNLTVLNMNRFEISGLMTTYADDRFITGSAAAGTALATGQKTSIGTIAKNSDHSEDLKSIAYTAKQNDMRVGIVTSVSIDHATPAVFYAHSPERKYTNLIASQMPLYGFDFFGGGYATGNFERNLNPDRNPDFHKPIDIEKLMTESGYTISKTRSEFDAMTPGKNWTFGTYEQGSGALNYEIDRTDAELSLADYTQKAIEMLENENGFFLMVEGGKIDWASHANDAATVVGEMLAFDEAIGKALAFYEKYPNETLIVITSDHETGGLGLGYAGKAYDSEYALLGGQKISGSKFSEKADAWAENKLPFEQVMDSVTYYFGLNDESFHEAAKLSDEDYYRLKVAYNKSITGLDGSVADSVKYGSYNAFVTIVTRILNEKAGIAWTTFSHTAGPVPVFAKGVGQEYFTGYYDNTDIPKKMMKIGKLK